MMEYKSVRSNFVKFLIMFFMMNSCFFYASTSYANETDTDDHINIDKIQQQQQESIEYDEIQSVLDETFQTSYNFNFRSFVTKAIGGEYDLDGRSLLTVFLEEIFKDLKANLYILMEILVICIVAAFFKNFSESFKSKQVADTGFLIIFLLIIALTLQSYHLLNNLATEVIDNLLVFVQALVPSLLTVTVLSGATISATMFGESLLMLIGIIDHGIMTFLLPALYVLLLFILMNALTDKDNLSKMVELLKNAYALIIKGILWVIIAFFGLQSFGLPIIDGFMSRTAKQTVGIVPVVGTTLAEISDIVLGCGTMIKNAFGIGAIVSIVIISIIPIIKIAVVALIYKVSSAFVEPISDSRIVTCLSDIGDLCFLLLGTVLIVIFMFVIAIAITLYLTNILLYIR